MTLSRMEVFKLIEDEREYQDWKWDTETPLDDIHKHPADWILIAEAHLNKAKNAHYNLNMDDVMAELRKVAATCVAAMEYCGAPERKSPRAPQSEKKE